MRLLRTTECYRICGWRILRWHLEVISESKRKPRTASTGFFLPLFILTIVCKNHTEWWKFPCGFLAEIFCPKSNPDIFFFPELLLQFLLEIITTSLSALKFCTVLLNTDKQLLHFSLCVGDLIRIYSLCIHTAGCKVICIHTTATTDPAEYYPFFLTFIAAFKTPTFFKCPQNLMKSVVPWFPESLHAILALCHKEWPQTCEWCHIISVLGLSIAVLWLLEHTLKARDIFSPSYIEGYVGIC